MDGRPAYRQMQANKIIVIHPGSLNLRIGRASDLNPTTILHAVARKRRCVDKPDQNEQLYKRDTLLPSIQKQGEALAEFEEQRLQVTHAIQAYLPHKSDDHGRGSKRMRVATPSQQIATFNRRSLPEVLDIDEDQSNNADDATKNAKGELKEMLFDEDILALNETDAIHYNIHFPMRRGELHLHSEIGGSRESVLTHLEVIWLHAIHDCMGIPRTTNALLQYSAVLVIPDVYNRSHLRELVSLILQRLRFRSCFLLQDHVAATFGAGLGYACVVDVGDQKCSISCVEDGVSQPETRVRLAYGSGDVAQVFQMLLKKCSFPYKECNVEASYKDAALINNLKEQFCHVNLDVCGAQEKSFEVKKDGKLLRYTLQLGDECIVAPLSFFHTELLNITGKPKMARIQLRSSQQPDAEDCFDAEYIRETGRIRNGRDQSIEGSLPITGDMPDDDLVVVDNFDVDTAIKNTDKEELNYLPNGQIMSLDQAIVRSIERCGSEDLKKKMYSCILLVGGGIKFPGFIKLLEKKVTLQLAATSAPHRASELQPFEVNVFVKEMDSNMIAWKGAAIMSCLESSPELWIFAGEWEKYGLRILREKAPFIW